MKKYIYWKEILNPFLFLKQKENIVHLSFIHVCVYTQLHLTKPIYFYKITHILQTQVNKLTARAVKCGSIEPAQITLLSFESGDQFMILFIVPGVTVGLSILDMTDWDIYRNMTTCTVCGEVFFSSDFEEFRVNKCLLTTSQDILLSFPRKETVIRVTWFFLSFEIIS